MTTTQAPRALLSAATVAAMLEMSRSKFLKMVQDGEAPQGLKLGRLRRWPMADVQAWIANGCRMQQGV